MRIILYLETRDDGNLYVFRPEEIKASSGTFTNDRMGYPAFYFTVKLGKNVKKIKEQASTPSGPAGSTPGSPKPVASLPESPAGPAGLSPEMAEKARLINKKIVEEFGAEEL